MTSRRPNSLVQQLLDARYQAVRSIGVPVRGVIAVACSLAAVVLVAIGIAHATRTLPWQIGGAFVCLLIVVLVSPRPFRTPVLVSGPSNQSSSAALIAEYAALARRRGRLALVRTLERTRSVPGREILAWLATDGIYSLAELRSSLETYRDPTLRARSARALGRLQVGWALELARILVIQSASAQETLDAATLYEILIARSTSPKVSREHQQFYVEALLDSELIDRAREVMRAWTNPTEQESRLLADSVSPFLGRGSDAATWLRHVNAGFVSAGLEPVTLDDSNAAALDRIVCVPTDSRDDENRVTVVITSFRPDPTLITSVKSALDSSWRNLEVLVIDDASGSDFEAVYAEVVALDARVRVERLSTNSGTYVGRNRALAIATGDFITFHDSDDWMHPRRLETQAAHLIANPEIAANATSSIRVTSDLGFSHHRSLAPKICEPSLMFRRELVLERIGYFDPVRKNGDSEYRRRLQAAFGAPVPVLGHVPLTWQRTVAGSLSFVDVGRNWISPARRAYMNCGAAWHAEITAGNASPYLAAGTTRTAPFYAPPELVEATLPTREFDVIFMSNWLVDGSHGGSQRSNEEEIRALTRAGMRVGIIHTEAFWFMHSRDSRLGDRITRMLNAGEVELVQLDSPTTTDLLVIRYPPILQFAQPVASAVVARRVVIVANQGPYDLDGTGRRYDIATTSARVASIFGRVPTWAPQGPLVRELLQHLVAREDLLDADVPAIVDPDTWLASRSPIEGRKPIVGRYSRDIASKWPEDASTVLAAYSSPLFETRIMGGPETLQAVFGAHSAVPGDWMVLAEGAEDTREFLASIDFFVYFHASYYREAFGRSIVEAMASGAVVILQDSFEPVFGSAAVYCAPAEVASVVSRLAASQADYDAQAARGRAFVEASSSYDSYVQLIRRLRTDTSAA